MATLEETLDKAIDVAVKRAILKAHPVGSLYLSLTEENPSISLGGGTWVKVGSGKCLWGADSSHAVGTEISAGLPNITGTWTSTWDVPSRGFYNLSTTGAFYSVSDASRAGRIAGQNSGSQLNMGYPCFDASKSNSIYGASTTVQPPALAVNIWKRTA